MKLSTQLKRRGLTKKDLAFTVLIITATFIFVYFNEKRLDQKRASLNNSFRFTVCITIGKVKNIRSSGPDLNYEFKVGENTYRSSERFIDNGKVNINGGHYIVKFQPEDPTNNEILLNSPVPSDVYVPDSGWLYTPFSFHQEQ